MITLTDTATTKVAELITAEGEEGLAPVSYTHLTLPTTPYV